VVKHFGNDVVVGIEIGDGCAC